ncbi:LIM domain protein [Dictyocaulus viviparus]|uniref:LIM domain protein n=1 Tax=Dictyocaulus viviparus TaxID=29172 RepID=A0A0D8XNG4_DICVI|nr:LIM domain protein [Dictyocaulus viviparus]
MLIALDSLMCCPQSTPSVRVMATSRYLTMDSALQPNKVPYPCAVLATPTLRSKQRHERVRRLCSTNSRQIKEDFLLLSTFDYNMMINNLKICVQRCRRYGQRCAGCDGTLEKEDLVRKARDKVFHIQCFQCSVCQRRLDTGEQLYILEGNRFVCQQDFRNVTKSSTPSSTSNRPGDILIFIDVLYFVFYALYCHDRNRITLIREKLTDQS